MKGIRSTRRLRFGFVVRRGNIAVKPFVATPAAIDKGHDDRVISVCCSPDLTRLFSKSTKTRIVWDVSSGPSLKDGEWNSPNSKENVLIVDLEFKSTPREMAYRAFKARPKPWWHADQAKAAIESEHWFAATFHSAWLLKFRADLKTAYKQLHTSHAKLDPTTAKLLPPVVSEVMALPEPAE